MHDSLLMRFFKCARYLNAKGQDFFGGKLLRSHFCERVLPGTHSITR